MALTEKEFSMIKKKMDKIDHRLDELYKNWHMEYGNANTIEECEEIKNFYKPYLEKYESKYRVLYHLLQKLSLISTHNNASSIGPSLAALDDATSLKQREWICSEPGEDILCQYSSIEECLTPSMPKSETIRLEPSLNVIPEGSLVDIPTVIKREIREQVPEGDLLGTSSETTYMEIPNTRMKTVHKSPTPGVPKSIQGTKEASRADALALLDNSLLLLTEEMLVFPLETNWHQLKFMGEILLKYQMYQLPLLLQLLLLLLLLQ